MKTIRNITVKRGAEFAKWRRVNIQSRNTQGPPTPIPTTTLTFSSYGRGECFRTAQMPIPSPSRRQGNVIRAGRRKHPSRLFNSIKADRPAKNRPTPTRMATFESPGNEVFTEMAHIAAIQPAIGAITIMTYTEIITKKMNPSARNKQNCLL